MSVPIYILLYLSHCEVLPIASYSSEHCFLFPMFPMALSLHVPSRFWPMLVFPLLIMDYPSCLPLFSIHGVDIDYDSELSQNKYQVQITNLHSLQSYLYFFFLMTDYHVCIAGGIYAQFTRGTFRTAKYPYRHIHAIKRHIKPSTHWFRFNTHSLPYPPYPHTCITLIKSDLFNTRSL